VVSLRSSLLNQLRHDHLQWLSCYVSCNVPELFSYNTGWVWGLWQMKLRGESNNLSPLWNTWAKDSGPVYCSPQLVQLGPRVTFLGARTICVGFADDTPASHALIDARFSRDSRVKIRKNMNKLQIKVFLSVCCTFDYGEWHTKNIETSKYPKSVKMPVTMATTHKIVFLVN
jgi:hypothetical protein